MAYKGRNSGGMRKTSGGSLGGSFRFGRRGIHVGPHVHVHMFKDYNQYLLSQSISFIILTLIVLVSILICFFSYDSQYIYDPILNVKNNFSDLQFGGFLIGAILLVFATMKRKTSKNAFKIIIGTLIGLIAIVLINMIGIFNFGNKYNEATFSEMYSESYMKVDVVGDKKTLFVEECKKLNENFMIKITVVTAMEYCMIFVNLYLLYTELKLQKVYEKIEKENEVLFDEEQNVKI